MPEQLKVNSDFSPGSFEFIEARIRRDAQGTEFGSDFERLCKWFLEHAPRLRGARFEKVWLWNNWPDRWGPDAGIDIVALDGAGDLWAVQAKADAANHYIAKREIDSFLSESSRPGFAYRLLMATSDKIGAKARQVIDRQEKAVGLILRGDLIAEQLAWPTEIGKSAKPLPRWKPRPHQAAAIRKVASGFKRHDRGRLVMACGTGKTLTALWIAERLKSRNSLVLVPSLSLVGQNLAEWGRHAAGDFDALVVCSDPSVAERRSDAAVESVAELGVKITTDTAEIRRFLAKRRRRSAVVFATYQSSAQVAAAQSKGSRPFDLAICDEAHRLAGRSSTAFATILDGKKIQARKRLFMTATPRYIKEHVKRQAAELDYELVSMDDEHVFGPELHVLTFHEAITADPPLLTDYQVVVIGVTDREARQWAEQGHLVRTEGGLETDARSLAARIGLAKAMKKYDLRRIISFHSSVARAERFVDADRDDSLPSLLPHLSRSSQPLGKLWARHISGHTPAGQRRSLLRGLGDLPDKTRGIVSNCACLGEGVDVPVLDGVAFIDPKRSMVDIIQAVGRVIRKSEGKKIGTVVIPVLIDESEDVDHALSNSAFDPVWQVLKALRAHDVRLADELDALRLSIGRQSINGGRIHLPVRIRLDCPRLLLAGFEQALYVRAVMATTIKPRLTVEQILVWADEYHERMGEWPSGEGGDIPGTDETWRAIDNSLRQGNRGLPGGSSLAQLLKEYRGKRNTSDLPNLSIEQLLKWMVEHKASTGTWPYRRSGRVAGTDEKWSVIDVMLRNGSRGLPGDSSLAKLRAEHLGVRNRSAMPKLTIKQILKWMDEHKASTGTWPDVDSGKIAGTDENWRGINVVLDQGFRGLPGNQSLAQILAQYRKVKNRAALPILKIERILSWMDEHKRLTGKWPTINSGQVPGTEENWNAINAALKRGNRGLPGRGSLAQLRAEHRSGRNQKNLSSLSVGQILKWIDLHKAATGEWPKTQSGQIAGTNETWAGINHALRLGYRKLPGGSSVARVISEHRGLRNIRNLSDLTVRQVLVWADEHYERTAECPSANSGPIAGTDETWSAINHALMGGRRGLPGGTSLAKLLRKNGRQRD